MDLLKRVLRKLDGHHYPQDYLCLPAETLDHPLQVYLVSGNRILHDISQSHVFAGYHPLVFILHSVPFSLPAKIHILFSQRRFYPNEIFHKKDAIARLSLEKIKNQFPGTDRFACYEGVEGAHRFLSRFHQLVTQWNNRLYNKKAGNVFLEGNLLQQVQVAYSVARNISLITIAHDRYFNLFPTDLHGQLGEDCYVISLRHEGKACKQVEQTGSIVVSSMDAIAYKTVYALGKNHMQDPRSADRFPFGTIHSDIFSLPLPENALAYRELELQTFFTHGIHKLLLFKIMYYKQLADDPATLAHVHNSYATWRYNNRLSGNYLFR